MMNDKIIEFLESLGFHRTDKPFADDAPISKQNSVGFGLSKEIGEGVEMTFYELDKPRKYENRYVLVAGDFFKLKRDCFSSLVIESLVSSEIEFSAIKSSWNSHTGNLLLYTNLLHELESIIDSALSRIDKE